MTKCITACKILWPNDIQVPPYKNNLELPLKVLCPSEQKFCSFLFGASQVSLGHQILQAPKTFGIIEATKLQIFLILFSTFLVYCSSWVQCLATTFPYVHLFLPSDLGRSSQTKRAAKMYAHRGRVNKTV